MMDWRENLAMLILFALWSLWVFYTIDWFGWKSTLDWKLAGYIFFTWSWLLLILVSFWVLAGVEKIMWIDFSLTLALFFGVSCSVYVRVKDILFDYGQLEQPIDL